jgi:hypothetical protein
MNIPYYYNSGYADDGVDIYTCLKCGEKIYVRSCYEPNFCYKCGVKYEGKKENIGNDSKRWYAVCFTEELYWSIEARTVEIWGEPATIDKHWTEKGYYNCRQDQSAKKILAEKRRYEEDDLAEIERQIADHHRIQNLRRQKDPNFDEEKVKNERAFTSKKEFRIVRKKEMRRHSCMVRKDIYLEKTGKKFNEHKDRLPYGAKEEITTGIKFIGTGKINV